MGHPFIKNTVWERRRRRQDKARDERAAEAYKKYAE